LLAQRPGRRVARIGENLSAALGLPFVEREERMLGHIDFAAHLADVWNVPAFELLRYVLERADVRRDILALGAVAARRGPDQLAALVAQRHRKAVDLGLGREGDRLVGRELEKPADAFDKVAHVFFAERIAEREHRHAMAYFGKPARRRRTDAPRRR